MAEPKSRKTGEHNLLVMKLTAEGVAMREQIDGLEARMLRLESEVATMQKNVAVAPRASKRPGAGPPPLPRLSGSMGAVPQGRKMSMSSIDVSEIAELVESLPPPVPRPKK